MAKSRKTQKPQNIESSNTDSLEQPDTGSDLNIVDARPTKRFFISVITRDITLTRAILDLVDNAVDGAARKRGAPDPGVLTVAERKRYDGLRIVVNCTEEGFEIADNCFGIPLDVARYYAFRIGHEGSEDEKMHAPDGISRIGLFGIGLKRALFKIGNEFSVRSVTESSAFTIEESVSNWLGRTKWDFYFKEFDDRQRKKSDPEIGTKIRVTELNAAVREEFANGAFVKQLANEVGDALQEYIRRGLDIEVTSGDIRAPVPEPEPALYEGQGLQPLALVHEIKQGAEAPVKISIYAGIGPRDLRGAGWNVFCNGRLVVARDQTTLTGWGAKEPMKIPKYHKQFDRFRGYAYFDSDDPQRLPWNTTKTGVDEESALYGGVREMMIEQMKPVIDLLNELRSEEKATNERGGAADQFVTNIVKTLDRDMDPKPVHKLKRAEVFTWPRPPVRAMAKSELTEIMVAFTRPKSEIMEARQYFKVDDSDDAAKQAFLYWLNETQRKVR